MPRFCEQNVRVLRKVIVSVEKPPLTKGAFLDLNFWLKKCYTYY